jgi:hypothetical protein
MEWHEAEGRYDELENVMYELVEDRALSFAEAAGIYERLLLSEDESLVAGGLPREEIMQGLAELSIEKIKE